MKDFNNFKISSQFYFCPYALSLDLYQGCPHSCRYCFSMTQYFANATMLNKVFGNVEGVYKVEKLELFLKGEYTDSKNPVKRMLQLLINEKQPLHIGGMYDPFPYGVEETEQAGKKFLELLNKYKYPAIISTKNPPAEYKELFGKGNYVLQVTLTTINDEQGRLIEPVAPLPSKRLEAIKELKPYVKKLVVRMQPYIPCLYEKGEINAYLKAIKDAGADAVTVEFLKVSKFQTDAVRKQWKEFGDCLNRDVLSELNTNGIGSGSDKEYPFEYKLKRLKEIRKLAHELGLEFYSAENQTRLLGDDYACCGIKQGELNGIFDSKMPCFNQLLFKAKEKGEITLNDLEIKEYMKIKEICDMWNTQDRMFRASRMNYSTEDFMEEAWKNPKSVNPAIFFKGLRPEKRGKDIIYKYEGIE